MRNICEKQLHLLETARRSFAAGFAERQGSTPGGTGCKTV